MDIKQKLLIALKSAFLSAYKKPAPAFEVFYNSEITNYGEFSSNIVLKSATSLQISYNQIAIDLECNFKMDMVKIVKFSLTNNHFNMKLDNAQLVSIIPEIIKAGNDFGKKPTDPNNKVIYEWISANPTGNLHVGHLRNAVIGNALSNILAYSGATVAREFYVNDAGTQIYNAGWTLYLACQQALGKTIKLPESSNKENGSKVKLYPLANYKIPANLMLKNLSEDVPEISWFDGVITPEKQVYMDFVSDYFLGVFKKNCADLGIVFDLFFHEKSLYSDGFSERFLASLKRQNLSYKKDGALWFKAIGEYMDYDLVLLKSSGEPTYFFGDVMYHANKFTRGFNTLYDLWGSDHQSHYFRVKSAMEALGYGGKNFVVDLMQMVLLIGDNKKALKMSKREGVILLWIDLVARAGADYSKYLMLSLEKNKVMPIDVNSFTSTTKQKPLFYMQYAHARAHQILVKAGGEVELTDFSVLSSLSMNHKAIHELVFALYHLEWAVAIALKNHEPHAIIQYLVSLSKKFHSVYQQIPILEATDAKERAALLQLVTATKTLLKIALDLVAISAPTKM